MARGNDNLALQTPNGIVRPWTWEASTGDSQPSASFWWVRADRAHLQFRPPPADARLSSLQLAAAPAHPSAANVHRSYDRERSIASAESDRLLAVPIGWYSSSRLGWRWPCPIRPPLLYRPVLPVQRVLLRLLMRALLLAFPCTVRTAGRHRVSFMLWSPILRAVH